MAQKLGCDIDFNNASRGINSLDPIDPQDLATKIYVDTVANPEVKAYSFLAARNANISSDQSLRRQNGAFISTCPYIVPFDSFIHAVTAENSPASLGETWDLVIEVNGTDIFTLSVPDTNHKAVDNTLTIAVLEGDEIVIFFRNASGTVTRPAGAVYLKKLPAQAQTSYNFPAGRNATISSDQALRRQNGTFISTCPYIIPYDSVIYSITAENSPSDTSETWDLEIEINGLVVATLSVTSSDHKAIDNSANILVNEGDELVIFFRNASAGIDRPCGNVFLTSVQ